MTRRRKVHSDVAPMVLEVKDKVSRSCAHLTTSESRSESGGARGGMPGRERGGKVGCPALGYAGVQIQGKEGAGTLHLLVCTLQVQKMQGRAGLTLLGLSAKL